MGAVLIAWGNWLPIYLPPSFDLASPTIKPALAVFVSVGMVGFMLTAWHYREPGDAVLSIAGYLLVFFYIGVLSAFLFQLRWLNPSAPTEGATALALAVFTPKVCDICAFFVGRRIGRTKLAPRLSPGKTVEGFIGGLAGAIASALWIGGLPIPLVAARPLLNIPSAAVFGVFVGLAAQIGDLMESLLKRDCRQKDASDAIPGFGGLLDVADSVLFSSPVAYFLLVGLGAWTRAV
jgi:phosphatidate cytidylyltransferase